MSGGKNDNYEKAVEHVTNELAKLGKHPGARSSIKIVCPFHADSDPSLSVNISNGRALPGTFFCFGCGASGNWNALAERLNLEPFNRTLAKRLKSYIPVVSTRKSYSQLAKEYKLPSITSDIEKPWKNVSPEFLNKLGCRLWVDPVLHEERLLLPVTVFGETVGHVTLPVNGKSKHKAFNSPGEWVRASFWPFDYVAERFDGNSCVIITEGAKDAMRLLYNGLPALANLGAVTTWSSAKADLLTYLDIETVIIASDGDEVGYKLANMIKKDCKDLFNVKWFRLPIKDKKIDPANMPKKMLNKLKRLVKEIESG